MRRILQAALISLVIALPASAHAWFKHGSAAGGGGPPGVPSGLAVNQIDSTTLQITFTGGSGATGHEARMAPKVRQVDGSNNVTWTSTGWWNAAVSVTSGSNVTSLDYQKGYDVQVRAVNGSGTSAWTSSVEGVTATPTYPTGGSGSAVSISGDSYLDAMLVGAKWDLTNKIITYAFPNDRTFYDLSSFGGNYGGEADGMSPLATTERNKVRAVLAWIQQFADVRFVEITEDSSHIAIMRYAVTTYSGVGTAECFFPGSSKGVGFSGHGGDCWYSNNSPGFFYGSPPYPRGSYQFHGYIHETGHGLGLKHPHDVFGSFGAMPLDKDALEYTQMSYKARVNGPNSYTMPLATGFPSSYMMLDIYALQALYGARYDTNTADTTYAWSSSTGALTVNGVAEPYNAGNNKLWMTVWDGGGLADKYDFTTSSYGAGTITPNVTQGQCMTTAAAQKQDVSDAQNGTAFPSCNVYNAQRVGGSTASDIESAQVP